MAKKPIFIWISLIVSLLATVFIYVGLPEYSWAPLIPGVFLLGSLGLLIKEYQRALSGRAAAYTINSLVTVLLVTGILVVLNFFVSRYPQKLDLTKNKLHTFSDQTNKLIKELKKPVKVTLWGTMKEREEFRPLFDNYKSLSPQFQYEFIDPSKEPTKAKAAGIKKYGTVQLVIGARDTKVEEVTEEKITNALIKLLKEKTTILCSLSGHGEKNFESNAQDGYESIKKAMTNQAYELKDLNLIQEGKIPENCDAIAILGATKGIFPQEAKLITEYLIQGGRAIIAVDLNIKGEEFTPELKPILESWYVRAVPALIVDPLSKLFGVDAAVPLAFNFSSESPITKDFQGTQTPFPLARPLEILPNIPSGTKVTWLAQSSPKSFGYMDLKSLATGQVKFEASRDKMGPLNLAVAIDGKATSSKANRNSRIVVFGSSNFATNQFSRMGVNLDLFMNAASWVMEDESMISIRSKEDEAGKVELTQKTGKMIFLLTVLVIPLLVAAAGITIWAFRRRL